MTVDVHCHYIPPAYLDLVRRQGARLGVGVKMTGGETTLVTGSIRVPVTSLFTDLAAQRAEMDTSAVDLRVLSPPPQLLGYHLEPVLAQEVCVLVNDATASAVREAGPRFSAWALVPLQAPDAATREAERAVRVLGMRGLYIGTNVRGRGLEAADLYPVYEVAESLGVPLLVHPWEPSGQEHLREFSLLALAGFLFDTTVQTIRLIFSGTLDRFPRLTFVLCHAGGFLIPLAGRLRRECAVTPAMGGSLMAPLEAYLRRFAYDTIGLDAAYLRHVVETVGPDRFLLGSDRPFPLGDPDPVGSVRALNLPAGDQEAILAGNARRLLRLDL